MKICQMTMSDNGRVNGIESFWKCGRPAKASIPKNPGHGIMFVCGIHAKAHDKTAVRFGFETSSKIVT